MDNITFEQLPQAVSMLIEKVGLLTDRVGKGAGQNTATEWRGTQLTYLE